MLTCGRLADRFVRGRLDFGQVGFVVESFHVHFVFAQALHFELRCLHVRVRHDHNAGAVAIFNLANLSTLFVEQEGCDIDGHVGTHFAGLVLAAFFFDQTKQGQGQ